MMRILFSVLESYKAQMRQQMKARGSDLDTIHVRMCDIIASEGRITPQALAKAIGRDKAQVTRMVAALNKRRYVIKVVNSEDARSVWLSLSDKGRDFIRDATHLEKQIESGILQGLSPDERSVFSALLKKIMININASEKS